LRPWALVALGWIAIVTPWTIRNAVRLHAVNEEFAGQTSEPLPTFVPLTLYGPINLALANNSMAQGGFSRDFMTSQAQNPGLDLKDPQHVEFILHGDRMAWTWIRENPGAFVRLVGRKWALVSEGWTLGWTQFDWPGGLNGNRRPVDMLVPDSKIGFWLTVPLSLLGLILCLATPGPSRRWTGVALAVTLSVLVATGLFFGYVRLGLIIFLFWLPFLGAALVWLFNLKNSRSPSLPAPADPPRRLWQTLAALAVLLLSLELWGVSLHRNFKATGVNVPGRTYLDRDAEIRFELLPGP
jgi:hypothetical protein